MALDGAAQLAVVLEREVRRCRTRQNENISLIEVVLYAVDQAQEIRVVQLAARLVDLGMASLRINDLRVDTQLACHIDKVMVNVGCRQHILHEAAVRAGGEAERDAVAAERLDSAGYIDALAARLKVRRRRTVQLADHKRVLDAQRAVERSVKRNRDNHGNALLKTLFMTKTAAGSPCRGV